MAQTTVWRIVRPEHAASPYSGEGARLHGGRFNSPGRAVAYASEALSLAMLEQLVRVGAFRRLRGFLCVPATLDDTLVTTAGPLPVGWDALPYTSVSQAVGDAWLDGARALALRVPSTVVPTDHNVLLNPLHPSFGSSVRVGLPVPVPVDPRLVPRYSRAKS